MILRITHACPRRCKSAAFGPNDMSGLLIDVTKHVSNLKYRVWEKLLDEIDYCKCTESILFMVYSLE